MARPDKDHTVLKLHYNEAAAYCFLPSITAIKFMAQLS